MNLHEWAKNLVVPLKERLQMDIAFTDTDLMPFGKHKGVAMRDVPAEYLDWLIGQDWINKWPRVEAYIMQNKKAIDLELKGGK